MTVAPSPSSAAPTAGADARACGVTRALAVHAAELDAAAIPALVRERAVAAILDTLGAGLYGRGTDAAALVRAEAGERYRAGASVLWGSADRLVPAGAALVNATQAHAFELDDYHPSAKCHPGAVVVPAALAAAPAGTSGMELIAAIVAGYDAMVRVSLASDAAATRRRGWHITGVAGPFGAAAAAGRVRGIDAGALAQALGIAGSCSAGLFAFSRSGAMTKRLHAGRAAEAGIVAVDLAARGFTGPPDVLEAEDGGLLGALAGTPDPARIVEQLGERFEVARTAVKPHPCCGSVHSSIDAVLELRERHGLAPADVEEIVVLNSRLVFQQCGFTWTGDGGVLEAQMSLQYCLAVALADGTMGLAQFAAARREDPEVRGLAARVRFVVEPEIDAAYPRSFPARVAIRTRAGTTVEAHVTAPRGSAERPCTPAELEAKFTELSADALDARRRARLRELLAGLEQLDDIAKLTELLAAA